MTVTTDPRKTGINVSGAHANTLVVFGDSITGQYSVTNSPPNVYSAGGSFISWVQAFLKRRFRIVNMAGVSGDTTALMLARIGTDVLAYSPGYCFVMGGTNDITGGVPYATTISNLQSIVSILVWSGIQPVIFTIPPNSGIVGVGGTTGRVACEKINEWIRGLARQSPRVLVVDWAGAVTNADGTTVSGSTDDNVHPGPLSGLAVGWLAATVLDSAVPKTFESRSNAQATNIVSNGRLSGNNASGAGGFSVAAGVSGNGPNGWFASRTGAGIVAVLSKVSSLDYRPDTRWQANITAGGVDGDRLQLSYTVNFRLWSSGMAVNDTTRIYVPSTGAHYRAVVGATGSLAAGADPTAGWTTEVGATFTNGTVTLQCCSPFDTGSVVQMYSDCNVTAIGAGSFIPRIQANFKNAAAVSQLILITGNASTGSYPSTWPYPSNFILETPAYALPAGFNLAETTTGAGPSIVFSLEAYTKASTTCTFSWSDVYCGVVA